MKKLTSLILCLMLCIPALALAETAEAPVYYEYDLTYFTMGMKETDAYQVAVTREDNQVYAMIYPDYDPNAAVADNLNFVWSSADDTAAILLTGAENYAAQNLSNIVAGLETYAIKVSESEVLDAAYGDGIGFFTHHMVLDYTGAGLDLVTEQYQSQVYYCFGSEGTWIVTLTSTTADGLIALYDYLDYIIFAE